MTAILLQALKGKNQGRPPVWLMRQAGRYLPEYRLLREKHSLHDLFFTPELAAQVTQMPLRRFPLDAAILFSDITVIAKALGFALAFDEGPKVFPEATPETLSQLVCTPELLQPVIETIALLKQEIHVPLLGFCGAPFTVATYLAGGVEKAVAWMRNDPVAFQVFLDKIQEATLLYAQMQERAGVDAFQIFDSWANVLTPQEFYRFSLPYISQLVQTLSIPTIFFMRGVFPYVEHIPCAISLDEGVSLASVRAKTTHPLQGNLSPDILFAPLDVIRQKTQDLLLSMQGDSAWILNLGHGVKPKTPVDAVHCFVDAARN